MPSPCAPAVLPSYSSLAAPYAIAIRSFALRSILPAYPPNSLRKAFMNSDLTLAIQPAAVIVPLLASGVTPRLFASSMA